MAQLVEGKVVVVTGGGSGIGRAICVRLAEHGARAVVVADLTPDGREGGSPTHELVTRAGAEGTFVETDMSDPDSLTAAIEAARDHGGIDVMVNNAGVAMKEDFFTMTVADFDRLMAVNVRGVFFGAQAAAAAMKDRGGTIINMSSVGGIRGGTLPAYSMSKGAVRLLTYALGATLGPHHIRVVAVHPGLTDTAMNRDDLELVEADGTAPKRLASIPLGRVGEPADVADVVVFLASDLARYVTGTSLVVDGGMLAT